MHGATLIHIQNVAAKLGRKEREFQSASPQRKIIIEIEMCALKRELENLSRPLKKEEWRVC